MDAIATDYPTGVIDLAARRVQRLEDEELRLLGHAVGDHALPPEVSLPVEAVRLARRELADDGPLVA